MQGHLRVPLWIRRTHHLCGGDRILLAAARDAGLCALYPAAVLDEALSGYHPLCSSGGRDAAR